MLIYAKSRLIATAVPQIIPGDMDRKYLAETVIRRDADAEPPRMVSRRVSARCLWFMSVVNNDFWRIHWHRVMHCVSPPKTRRRPIHGGSNPASDHYGRWKCRFCRSKNLPCGIRSLAVKHNPCLSYLWDSNAMLSISHIHISIFLQDYQYLPDRD